MGTYGTYTLPLAFSVYATNHTNKNVWYLDTNDIQEALDYVKNQELENAFVVDNYKRNLVTIQTRNN